MAEAQLRQFLDKVRQLNAFVAMSEADPRLRQELRDCEHHDQVVALARRCGFEIGRRWGEPPASSPPVDASAASFNPGAGGQPAQAGGSGGPWLGVAADDAAHSRLGRADSAECPDSAAGTVAASEPVLRSSAEPGADVSGRRGGVETLRSLLAGTCPPAGGEVTEVLIETPLWRLERIHSCDHRSPDGFWYEQQEDEWVMLLQGTARLRCADQPSDQELRPGDSIWLRAGRRHRVTATDPAPGTIWLALFWREA